jgi:hypothetical protein
MFSTENLASAQSQWSQKALSPDVSVINLSCSVLLILSFTFIVAD